MSTPILQTIRDLLTDEGVAFREVHHEPTYTSEESARALWLAGALPRARSIPGSRALVWYLESPPSLGASTCCAPSLAPLGRLLRGLQRPRWWLCTFSRTALSDLSFAMPGSSFGNKTRACMAMTPSTSSKTKDEIIYL
jgi:hypothetical protein